MLQITSPNLPSCPPAPASGCTRREAISMRMPCVPSIEVRVRRFLSAAGSSGTGAVGRAQQVAGELRVLRHLRASARSDASSSFMTSSSCGAAKDGAAYSAARSRRARIRHWPGSSSWTCSGSGRAPCRGAWIAQCQRINKALQGQRFSGSACCFCGDCIGRRTASGTGLWLSVVGKPFFARKQ